MFSASWVSTRFPVFSTLGSHFLKKQQEGVSGSYNLYRPLQLAHNTNSCSLPCLLQLVHSHREQPEDDSKVVPDSLRCYFGSIWAKLAEATRNKIYSSSWNTAQRKIFICLLKIVSINPSSLSMVKNLEWPDLKNDRRQPANTSFIKRERRGRW